MQFKTVPNHLSQVPINIRKNAETKDISIHDDWTDVLLLNLWHESFHDDDMIEASLGMSPNEVLS